MLLSALTLAAEWWWLALLAIRTRDLANISSALNSLSWRSGWRPPTWFHSFLGVFFLIEFLSHTFSYQKIFSAHFQLHTVTLDAKLLSSSRVALHQSFSCTGLWCSSSRCQILCFSFAAGLSLQLLCWLQIRRLDYWRISHFCFFM